MIYGTGAAFEDVAEHFTGNSDDNCFMDNQDGSIKILASVGKKKTDKNCDDCRASIKISKGRNCFGSQGPFIFLSNVNMVGSKFFHELDSNRSLPPHSHVVQSTNAYMTDEVYLGLVTKLCKGIHKIPVVRDHKNWWCVWSL